MDSLAVCPEKPRGGKFQRSDGERIAIQLLVDYRADGGYLFDFCRDLGEGGLFIASAHPYPQGTRLELTFTIPDSKETITTCGRVIWVQAPCSKKGKTTLGGMGVQFEAMADEQRQSLGEFVQRYSTRKKIA